MLAVLVLAFAACEREAFFTDNNTNAGGVPVQLNVCYAAGTGGQIWKTSDLEAGAWLDISTGSLNYNDVVVFGGRLYRSGGAFPPNLNGFVQYSDDGSNWIDIFVPGTVSLVKGMHVAGSMMLAFGDDGGSSRQIRHTVDGTNWILAATVPSTTNNIKAAASGGGVIITVGGFSSAGEVLRSTDGQVWELKTPGGCAYLNGVAFSDLHNRFIAVGNAGAVYYSDDFGGGWTATSAGSQNLNSVVYASGLFVAVGSNGVLFTSVDGLAWAAAVSGTTAL